MKRGQRNNQNRNNGGGHGKKRSGNNNGSVLKCWYCEKPLGKNRKIWGGHKVHANNCYEMCCKKLITGANLAKKIRAAQPPKPKGFFARLFS